jgi:hypothetical protein
MSEPVSRRKFLATGAVGAAAVSAATLAASTGALGIGGLLGSAGAGAVVARPSVVAPQHDLTAVGTDIVAHVRNASTGEVLLMVGTSEALIHDRALVSRLLAGARTVGQES